MYFTLQDHSKKTTKARCKKLVKADNLDVSHSMGLIFLHIVDGTDSNKRVVGNLTKEEAMELLNKLTKELL